jgi:transcriptional regulator with XRE-family HTH domain
MKQPELGRKIIELRKEKGLTQEELVDKCNISVRTLQRIEAGEVTPRDYTVKTILAALDYDLAMIADKNHGVPEQISAFFKNLLYIDVDLEQPADYLTRQLTMAWIFGLVNFLTGLPEGLADYTLIMKHELIFHPMIHVALKLVVWISYIFFLRGFILTGFLYQNYLLKIISYILMFAATMSIGYDITCVLYEPIAIEYVLGAEALLFGGILILFGISLFRLRKPLGDVAFFAGFFEILAGACFLTVILGFAGLIVLIPASILEIVVLFKVTETIKKHKPVFNAAGNSYD